MQPLRVEDTLERAIDVYCYRENLQLTEEEKRHLINAVGKRFRDYIALTGKGKVNEKVLQDFLVEDIQYVSAVAPQVIDGLTLETVIIEQMKIVYQAFEQLIEAYEEEIEKSKKEIEQRQADINDVWQSYAVRRQVHDTLIPQIVDGIGNFSEFVNSTSMIMAWYALTGLLERAKLLIHEKSIFDSAVGVGVYYLYAINDNQKECALQVIRDSDKVNFNNVANDTAPDNLSDPSKLDNQQNVLPEFRINATDPKTFGQGLKAARLKVGLKPTQMARALEMDYSNYARIERGDGGIPEHKRIREIAKILGSPISLEYPVP